MPSGRPSAIARSRGFPRSPPRTEAPTCSAAPTGPGPSLAGARRPERGRHVQPLRGRRPVRIPSRETPPSPAVAADPPAARASVDPAPPPPALAARTGGSRGGAEARVPVRPSSVRPAPRVPARPRVSPPAEVARGPRGPTTTSDRLGPPKEVPPAPEPRRGRRWPPRRRRRPAGRRSGARGRGRRPASAIPSPRRRSGVAPPAPAAALPPAAGAASGGARPHPPRRCRGSRSTCSSTRTIPAERLVFINGRKYVEGQTVDGDDRRRADHAGRGRPAAPGAGGSCCGRSSIRTPARGRLDTIAVPLGQWLGRAGSRRFAVRGRRRPVSEGRAPPATRADHEPPSPRDPHRPRPPRSRLEQPGAPHALGVLHRPRPPVAPDRLPSRRRRAVGRRAGGRRRGDPHRRHARPRARDRARARPRARGGGLDGARGRQLRPPLLAVREPGVRLPLRDPRAGALSRHVVVPRERHGRRQGRSLAHPRRRRGGQDGVPAGGAHARAGPSSRPR